MTKQLTTEEFKEKIFDFTQLNENNQKWHFKGGKPCIIDFYAEWCGPCKMVEPILEELSDEYSQIDFYKVNTETESEISQVFGIKSIPTILFIPLEGDPQINMGALPKEDFIEGINNVLLGKETE